MDDAAIEVGSKWPNRFFEFEFCPSHQRRAQRRLLRATGDVACLESRGGGGVIAGRRSRRRISAAKRDKNMQRLLVALALAAPATALVAPGLARP